MENETDYKAEALERIDALAEKLGVMSEHLWEVLAAGAYGEAVGTLLLWLAALSMGAWLVRRAFAVKHWHIEHTLPGPSCVFAAAGGLLLFVSLLAAPQMPDDVAVLFSPEYGAWLKVLEVLR